MAKNKPVWAQNFENAPPTENENGGYTSHVGWLDFIHRWNTLSHEENVFARSKNLGKPDEWDDPNRLFLWNSCMDVIATDGTVYPYTETYLARETENHDWSIKFILFLDNEKSRSRFECFDPTLKELCEKFQNAN